MPGAHPDRGKQALKVRYGQKGGAQGGHIPSIGRPHFDSGKDALKVCDFFKGFTELCPQPGITYKRAYSLLPTCNAGRIIKGDSIHCRMRRAPMAVAV